MLILAQILSYLLAALVIGQGVLVVGFVWRLLSFRHNLISDHTAPRAAVILCLRGGDPFLRNCIQGLLAQDYPNYEVHFVIDHPDDPAVAIVNEHLSTTETSNLHVQFLKHPLETCSLKCSSLVQAIRSLDDSVEFIAQLDADTIPHATWLRELATALDDEAVGAATGNRWYMPDNPSLPALVRYLWNAAAIVQMYWYKIAWGGTLAVKTKLFRETGLLDRWSHAFCEDTLLFAQLKKSDLRLAFVPSLMMINREDCELRGFYSWVRRQLVTTRLHHPAWAAVVGHGVISIVAPFLLGCVFVLAWVLDANTAATLALSSLIAYQAVTFLMLFPMEFAVRRIVAARGEPTRWLGVGGFAKALVAVLMTQVIYGFALFSASRMRSVSWRGVQYRIGPGDRIQLIRYQSYQPTADQSATSSI